jgi:hypothetical protein
MRPPDHIERPMAINLLEMIVDPLGIGLNSLVGPLSAHGALPKRESAGNSSGTIHLNSALLFGRNPNPISKGSP